MGLIANITNSIIVSYVLSPFYELKHLALWTGSLTLLVLVRFILIFRYKKHKETASIDILSKYERSYFLATFLSGLTWGSIGILFFPDSLPHQAFIAFVLAGMAAGASSIYIANMRYSLSFTLCTIVPVVVSFFMGNTEIQLAMGIMSVIFILFMVVSQKNHHKHFMESLQLKVALQDTLNEKVSSYTYGYPNASYEWNRSHKKDY